MRFETFVVADRSRRAFDAAIAAAANPGCGLNPLVLYGRTGSGKTHLMHAIAHRIRNHRPAARVIRTSTSALVDEMIAAFRSDRCAELRNSLITAEALLLEDLDLLADRPRTLEEMLLLIEFCVRSSVQVVITTTIQPTRLGLTPERIAARSPRAVIAKLHVAREVLLRRAAQRVAFEAVLR